MFCIFKNKSKSCAFFIILFFNLLFICFSSVLGADELAPEQINTASFKPLDHIFSRVEKIKEPYTRCTLLIKIAGVHTQLGEYTESEKILTQAIDIAQDIENQLQRLIVIATIADGFISFKRNETALELLKYINDTDIRADILIRIISNYLQQNQFEEVVELVQEINKPSLKALALYRIIERLSTQKEYEELAKMQNIAQLQSPSVQMSLRLILRQEAKKSGGDPVFNLFTSVTSSKKVRALITLAKDKLSLGDLEATDQILIEATSLSEYIKGYYVKSECLAQIGMCYIQIGKLEEARRLADSIKIPFPRAELLSRIAISYAEINDFQAALRIISDINVQCFREKALAQIIIRHLEQGQEQEASGIMKILESSLARSRVYAAVVTYCLEKKNFTQALEMSQKIEDRDIKIIALIEIAEESQKEKVTGPELYTLFIKSLSPSED